MIQVKTIINKGIKQVWDAYNNPDDIKNWNSASPDWHCPTSQNELSVGGKFSHTMAAKDGSYSFDFAGTYTFIEPLQIIRYRLDDGRNVAVTFNKLSDQATELIVDFEAEKTNTEEMQLAGWQAILNNFNQYISNK